MMCQSLSLDRIRILKMSFVVLELTQRCDITVSLFYISIGASCMDGDVEPVRCDLAFSST